MAFRSLLASLAPVTTRRRAPWQGTLSRLRVPLGIVVAVAFFVFARPTPGLLLGGLPWVAGGLGLRAWSAGTLRKRSALAVTGPYAHTRNPLYLGSLLMALGFVLAGGHPIFAAAALAIFALVYSRTIRDEERFLRGRFPEYDAYARLVPRLIPQFRRARLDDEETGFSWAQYRHNREYEALVGVLAAYGVLVVEALGVRR